LGRSTSKDTTTLWLLLLGRSTSEETTALRLLLLGRSISEKTTALWLLLLLGCSTSEGEWLRLLLGTCIPKQTSSRLGGRVPEQTCSCRLRLRLRVRTPKQTTRGRLLGGCRITKETTGCRLLWLLSTPC